MSVPNNQMPQQDNQNSGGGGHMPTQLERMMSFLKGGNKQGQQNQQRAQGGGDPANAGANSNPTAKGPGGANPNPQGGSGNNGQPQVDENGNPISQEAQTPLEPFKDLWQPKKDKDGNPIPDGEDDGRVFNPDMKALSEAIGKMDFTKDLPEDVVENALKGDRKSFSQAQNMVVQKVLTQALLGSSQLIETALKSQVGKLEKKMSEQFRNLRTSEQLAESNPAFSDPAVAPLINMVQQQFAKQFPGASPSELKAHAVKYLEAIAGTISGKPGSGNSGQGPNLKGQRGQQRQQEQDFSQFFSGETNSGEDDGNQL